MPKRITSLTDTEVRSAKPQEKQYKLFDGGGLFLLVTPQGGKLWRCKYRYENKEKLLTFGAYPELVIGMLHTFGNQSIEDNRRQPNFN